MYLDRLPSFDITCDSPYTDAPDYNPWLEMYFVSAAESHYCVKVSCMSDIGRLYFESIYPIDTLQKDAEIWSEYVAKYAS